MCVESGPRAEVWRIPCSELGEGSKAKKCVLRRREELAASKAADGPLDSAEVTGDLNKSKLVECLRE